MAATQGRVPVAFSSAEAALTIDKSHFPTDFLIALNGHTRHPSGYATDPVELKAILAENQFSDGKDKVYLWLAQQELGADMKGAS